MKNLIHEIHQRSLWQVLGVYLAGSWVALQVVEQLTRAAGLPEWVQPFSLVLLVLGLPVVLATAFIQEGVGRGKSSGVPSSSGADAVAAILGTAVAAAAAAESGDAARSPAESGISASGSVDSAATAAEARPARVFHRLFTWRNAVLGGLGAFALLGLLAFGYLALRSLGIGPAGTLVAQGMLEEGAKVVLADFESPDSDLARVVTGALRIDLLQSPTIHVVERSQLSEALRRMQREPDAPLTARVARELAAREGYPALIEGEIGTAGSSYVLTARIVGGEDWTALAGFRETARGDDELIEAIEDLSRDIRDKAGESLRSVRGGPPLGQVTTGSLEALRTYTRAQALENAGDDPGAAGLYGRAIEIDPEFAMAHRKLGVTLGNMGVRRPEEVAALRRAYELRDRLPDAERYLAEAYYETSVRGDRDAAIRAYESLLGIDPDNQAGLNNLGNLYRDRGRLEEAEALYARALGTGPFPAGFLNLAVTRLARGKVTEALATLDTGAVWMPDAEFRLEDVRVLLALSAADYDRSDSLAHAFAARFRRPVEVALGANLRFILEATRGRLREAERQMEDFGGAPGFLANPMLIAAGGAGLATVRGDSAGAVRRLLDAYAEHRDSLPPADRVYGLWLPALIEAGGITEAAGIYEEWKREVPEEDLGTGGRDARRMLDARLAFARGDVEESVRLWKAYERECPGTCVLAASLGLARAHEAVGDAAAAIAEYERFLANRWLRWFWDPFARGPVLERLGQLYDTRSDLENAAKYYAMFVELWGKADPEIQPRVQAAQARLEEIVRERG